MRAYSFYNTNKLYLCSFFMIFFLSRVGSSTCVCARSSRRCENIHTHTRFFPTIRSFSLSLFLPWRDRRPTHPNERTNAKRGKGDLRERHADCKKEKRERNAMMHLLWVDPYHRRTTRASSRFKKNFSQNEKERTRSRRKERKKKSD